jgi:hypothetical protein
MMPKSAVELIIEAGLVPQGTVQQLVNWRALPETMTGLHGRRPVSLERDSTEAAKFAEALATQVAREEQSIRETEFTPMGSATVVRVHFSDGTLHSNVQVVVDKHGQIHVPAIIFHNGRPKGIESIAFNLEEVPTPVISVEPRYTGEKVTSYVCQLEV